jgi:hypothetical protein
MANKMKDAADWMLKKFNEDDGILYQEEAALAIEELFGEGVTYLNENGSLAIDPAVLKEFRKLTEDTVVWVRGERYWRRRESFDEPGRRSDL